MKFVGTLAFYNNESVVALVRKNTKKLPHLNGRWNGIGGKIEIGESPVGAAMREFTEETGIPLLKDDMVFVEHQRFPTGIIGGTRCVGDEIYWYATRLSHQFANSLPSLNDVGEFMKWEKVEDTHGVYLDDFLCPNIGYLIPKAIILLRTPYLDRSA